MIWRVRPTALLALLVLGVFASSSYIKPVRAIGTIYIKADGSIAPPTAPISRSGDYYTLTGDITSNPDNIAGIMVEKNSVTIDGAGYTLQGNGSGIGFVLHSVSYVAIKNTRITNFAYGIYLDYSASDSFLDNNITDNDFGISLGQSSNGSSFSGNYIATTDGVGIDLYTASSNSFSGNNITNNHFGVMLQDSSDNSFSDNHITANYGMGIHLSNASSNSFSGNNIANNHWGIRLDFSSNCIISGNDITDNYYGIEFQSSSSNTISGNNIAANDGFGVRIFDASSGNSFSGNNITNNRWGIDLSSSSGNSLSGNNITANGIGGGGYGIGLSSSSGNSFSGNNIANNHWGIRLSESNGNSIYHNEFFDNDLQVYSQDSVNVWDDGYPSGGNYWSDYSGVDLYCGPFQNETGSDGIGDSQFILNENNTDQYPLVKPYSGLVDVGVTNLAAYPSVVRQGLGLNVSCKVVNYGIEPAMFNGTLDANGTTLTSFTDVLVESRSSTVLEFVWNTSGVNVGNYIITVYLSTLENESDTSDNTRSLSIAVSNLLGDINGDGRVDMKDVSYVARRFMCLPSDTLWDSAADINGDGKIDMKDISTVARHFGEHYP